MNNVLGNILGQNQPAAPAQPAAPVQPVTPVQPTTQPVTPVTPVAPAIPGFGQPTTPAPVAPTPASPAPALNLGGGGRLAAVKNALMAAKVGSKRNDIPLGTGLYLLKEGKYTVTERSNTRLTNYSFICIKGTTDGMGVPIGGPSYTGPIPGEEYSTALFHDGDYAFSSILKAVAACFGWSKEMVNKMQSEERIMQLIQLIDMFTGVSSETCQPTNQPCCFSNQIILEMSSQNKVSEVKVNGIVPLDPATNKPMTKSYTNTFWNKRVPLEEALAGLDSNFIIKAFGSQEAIVAALETEKQLDAFA